MSKTKFSASFFSPLGKLFAIISDKGIHALEFEATNEFESNQEHPLAVKLGEQLKEYFEGNRKDFELPVLFEGTPFQKNVWQTLTTIPYANTISYFDFAVKCQSVKAVRAVAAANGKNRHLIIVPCHRVIGSDGTLTGYAGGLDRKKNLLDMEKKFSGSTYQLGLGL